MRDRAIAKLTDPAFRALLKEQLGTWEGADPAAIDRTIAWILQLREDLVSLIRTIDDDEQIAETLAINYIEIKTRWIALNTKINYQTFRQGACDPERVPRHGVQRAAGRGRDAADGRRRHEDHRVPRPARHPHGGLRHEHTNNTAPCA
jgi:hypothetical protein